MRKLFLFAILVSVISCQENLNLNEERDANTLNDEYLVCNGRLVFSSSEQFTSVLNLTSEMDDKELREWENQLGFKSFKTVCDDAYDNLLSKDFNTTEELISNVQSYSEYVFLEDDDDGELTLDTKDKYLLYNSIINEDRTYQIADTVYKAINGEIFFASIEDTDKLLLVNETNCDALRQYNELDSFKEIENFVSAKKASSCYVCDIDGDEINNKRKVYLRISTIPTYSYSYPDYNCKIQFHSRTIAYKKVLGVWVKYNTTHTHDMDYKVGWYFYGNNGLFAPYFADHEIDGVLETDYYVSSPSTRKEYDYYKTTTVGQLWYEPTILEADFGSWNCKAKTTGTNPDWVVLQCNLPGPVIDCGSY